MRLVRFPADLVRGLEAGTLDRPPSWHPEYAVESLTAIVRMLLAAYEAMGWERGGDWEDASPWWVFGIELDGVVVGDAGFHGPPASGAPVEVKIGYQVVPALRGRGLATRACGLQLEHSWRHGADRVLADAEPENLASRAVLRANGFRLLESGGFAVERPPVRTGGVGPPT